MTQASEERVAVTIRTVCLACSEDHVVELRVKRSDLDHTLFDSKATASAAVQGPLKAVRCTCGLTLGEAAELHRRREAGKLL